MPLHRKTIAIRTNYGSDQGIGHLVRMSFLANELAVLNRQVIFLLGHRDDTILPFLKGHECHYIYNQEQTGLISEKDAALCLEMLKPFNVEMVVVDTYLLGIEWESIIKKAGHRITAIDDIQRKHDCNILVDQAWNGRIKTSHRYDHLVPQNCTQLLGPRYAMIDPVYSSSQPSRPKTPTLLFSLGGGGDLKPVHDILVELTNISSLKENLCFMIILGPLSQNKSLIFKLAQKDSRIFPVEAPPSLHPYYVKASLFIGALGTSFYETSALRMPSLTFNISDTQESNVRFLEDFGHYFHIPFEEFKNSEKLANLICVLLSNLHRITQLRAEPAIEVDGRGIKRIAKAICSKDIDTNSSPAFKHRNSRYQELSGGIKYREVKEWDINHYLQSRNHEKNLLNMTTADSIPWVDHYKWWFTNSRSSYIFKKEDNKALYIWHESVDYNNQSFLIGGWFVCDGAVGFEMATIALKWQLDMTEKEYPGVPWIAIIKKTNKFVNLLNRYMGFVAVEPGEPAWDAIRHFFKDPSPEEFNFVKKI